MKRAYLLLLATSLAACERHAHNIPLSPMLSATKPSLTILFMGQSNARNLAQQGGAAMLSQDMGRNVSVISCAVGGSSIDQWQKGQGLYEACLTAITGKHIDAIWFDQGEAEIEHGTSTYTYQWAPMFTALARNIQHDIPHTPIFFAILSTEWLTWPGAETAALEMKSQQQQIPPSVAIAVDISDIGMGQYVPHYDLVHYQEIADRLGTNLRSYL